MKVFIFIKGNRFLFLLKQCNVLFEKLNTFGVKLIQGVTLKTCFYEKEIKHGVSLFNRFLTCI